MFKACLDLSPLLAALNALQSRSRGQHPCPPGCPTGQLCLLSSALGGTFLIRKGDEDSITKRQNCRYVKADSSGFRAGRCVCGEMGTDSSVLCWNRRGQGTARLGTPGRDNGLEVRTAGSRPDLLGTPNRGVDRGVGRKREKRGR